MQLKHALTALLAVLLAGSLVAGAAALGTSGVTVDDHEDVEVTVEFSGDTSVDVTITDEDDEEVATDTLDGNDETITETYDVEPGDYDVDLVATDDTAVESDSVETVSIFEHYETSDTLVVDDADDTVVADVELTADTVVQAELIDENGTMVDNATAEVVDGDYTDDSTEWVSMDLSPEEAVNHTVDLSADDTTAVNQTEYSIESGGLFGGGGIIAGAGQTELLAFGALVIGLIYAYREDYI